MAADQGADRLAAAFIGEIAHLARIDAGRLQDERRLHPVLAADGAAGADLDRGRVLLQGLDALGEGLEAAVLAHGEHPVIGADRAEPAHVGFAEAAELALGEIDPGAGRDRDDDIGVGGALRLDVVIGDGADAARHVGGAD